MKTTTYILALFFTMIILTGYSQESDNQSTSKLKFDKSGHVEYIKFDGTNKTGKWDSPTSPGGFFSSILDVQGKDEFVEKNKTERKDGSYYLHYRQQCKGIEVEGGIYILHFGNGKLTKANGHYVNTTGIDTSPKLTPGEASKSYAEYLKIPNDVPVKFLHGLVISEIREVSGKDTLYDSKLCYKIDLLGITADKGETGYIDAQTGEVLKTLKRGDNISATGTFYTLYSATKDVGTQHYNSTYNLCDSTRTATIHTWDLNNNVYTSYSSNGVEFTDANNIWTVNEHSVDNDQMALDIHWALQKIFDYFVSPHGLHSFDGNNHPIDAFAHAVFENNDKDNAGYVAFSNGDQAFFFGDGQTKFKPVAALDAVAHEFAHGITRNYTGLVRDYDVQSGMNEGFSDIWGTVVEAKVAPEKSRWKIGEEIIKVSGQDCLRDIQNPESTTSNTKIADTYGDNVYTTGDFYAKSGVMSHWFYLLANGGSGTNHNNVSYTVYGLGLDEAARVVFEGQTGHFANVTSYSGARTAMIDAANILYGANSFQSLQVANAWYAVGVGTNPGQPTISGPQTVCYSSASTFTANNAPTGFAISWSVDPATLTIVSGGNTTTPSIRAASSSSRDAGWIQAKFTSSITPTITSDGPKIKVSVNGPYYNDISFDVYKSDGTHVTNSSGYTPTLCANTTYHIYVANSGSCSTSNYSWTIPSGWTNYYTWSNMISINTNSASGGNIIVSANTSCNNNVVIISGYMSSGSCGGYYLAISPNPTTSETTVELMPEGEKTIDENIQWELDVYDQMQGTKAKDPQIKGKQTKINTSNWKDGVYVVRAIIGDKIITEKLVVKH